MHQVVAENPLTEAPGVYAKPTPSVAMQQLIRQIRNHFPFYAEDSFICQGPCEACTKKLLEYLDSLLCDWEYRLSQGECPKLGDLNALARKAKKIHGALARYHRLESNALKGHDYSQ